MGTTGGEEKRREARRSTLKRGHIVDGESVHDCLVLELSETGARVRTGTPVNIPERVVLHLAGGASFPAMRRWARGEEIGLSLLAADGSLRPGAADHAWAAYEKLREGRLDEAIRLLRIERFFDDEQLRQFAEEAEAARARLEGELRDRARRSRPEEA